MGKNKETAGSEAEGRGHSGARTEISVFWSIRTRIILLGMAAIMIVGMTQIVIFGSMSRDQFKDTVMCYMDDLAESYGKTMNIRVADLRKEGKEPDTAFWEEMVAV